MYREPVELAKFAGALVVNFEATELRPNSCQSENVCVRPLLTFQITRVVVVFGTNIADHWCFKQEELCVFVQDVLLVLTRMNYGFLKQMTRGFLQQMTCGS